MYMSAHRHHPQGLPAWCASAKLAKQNEKARVFSRNIAKNRQSLYENDNEKLPTFHRNREFNAIFLYLSISYSIQVLQKVIQTNDFNAWEGDVCQNTKMGIFTNDIVGPSDDGAINELIVVVILFY